MNQQGLTALASFSIIENVRIYFLLTLAAAALLILCGVQPQHSHAQSAEDPSTQQRVIIQINRHTEVPGYIALEDNDVITIRNLKGEVESFPKPRVLNIVRLVEPKPGQTGMVILRDGQIREGVIVEDAFEHVLLEIQGIRAKLKREIVSHIILQPSVEERYERYKANLVPGHHEAHLALCKWLVDQRRYDLAQQELLELQAQFDTPEVRRLLTLVNAQLALKHRPERSANEEEAEQASAPLPEQIISKEDVNLIRVYEIDFERPPKVVITPDTVRAIIDRYGTNKLVPASQTERNAMFRAARDTPMEIVKLMFDLRARDLYSQIQVTSEPYSLNLFRQRVHDTWLMNNCATSRCHGGPDAGALFLHRKNYKDDRVRYTNFLILERLQLDPNWPLINYDKPMDSLIIQYGLSREDGECRKPHPPVADWTPAFKITNPRMKHDTVDWIRSMMSPRPDYPVDYMPPQPAKPVDRAPDQPRPER